MAAYLLVPFSQFFDNNGDPLSGGKVFSYAAGTTTPKATYTDATGTTPNSNPVVLDAAGRASIWIAGNYKFVLTDSAGITITSIDNVQVGFDGTTPTAITFSNTGLQVRDIDNTHNLIISPGSNLTANRTFSLVTGDANRTLTLSADVTLDQNLSTTSAPQFASGFTVQQGTTTGPAVYAKPPLLVNYQYTQIGNIGAGTDDLMSYTLPTASISAIGKAIKVRGWGRTANNANAKTLAVDISGAAGFSRAMTVSTANRWVLEYYYTFLGGNAKVDVVLALDGSTVVNTTQNTPGQNPITSAITFKFTAVGVADNDIVQDGMEVTLIN